VAVEDSVDAAVVAAVVVVAEAAPVTRVRTGLQVAGRWTIPIFRRDVLCSWLRKGLRWRRMTAEAVGEDEAAGWVLSLG
jgi:hypothetical protein